MSKYKKTPEKFARNRERRGSTITLDIVDAYDYGRLEVGGPEQTCEFERRLDTYCISMEEFLKHKDAAMLYIRLREQARVNLMFNSIRERPYSLHL